MSSSKLQIANMALLRIGQEPIADFNSETDYPAIIIRNFYDQSVEYVLRLRDWAFATKRLQLARDPEIPAYEYDYQFSIPDKSVKIQEVVDTDGRPIDFEIEGQKILTNCTPIKIKHTINDVEYAPYVPEFVNLLEHRLAYKIAYPITQSNAKENQMFDSYKLTEDQDLTLDQKGSEQDKKQETYEHTSSWSD